MTELERHAPANWRADFCPTAWGTGRIDLDWVKHWCLYDVGHDGAHVCDCGARIDGSIAP